VRVQISNLEEAGYLEKKAFKGKKPQRSAAITIKGGVGNESADRSTAGISG